MKVIYGLGKLKAPLKNTCCAIGIFDGLHRGHQYLIGQMIKKAKQLKARSMVITFFPHPAHVLRPDIDLPYLVSLPQRLKLIEQMGVDICVVIGFNNSFATIEPQGFITDVLCKRLGVKAVFVGEDFRFGRKRQGDAALFRACSEKCGYTFHAVGAVTSAGQVISSTRLRQLIAQGQLSKARQLLGRRFTVEGNVVAGSRRGRKLGYPTANVSTDQQVLLPRGVYVVQVRIATQQFNAIANIGTRPSFQEKEKKVHLEVYVLDVQKNFYGKKVTVEFIKKIRDEKMFNSAEELITQIRRDERIARQYFSKS